MRLEEISLATEQYSEASQGIKILELTQHNVPNTAFSP